MPPQELEAHRTAISVLVDVTLDGYWRDEMGEAKRALILADWADELENWPVDSIKAALRQWRRENPSKKPNPGHILQILKKAWGERHVAQVREVVSALRPPKPLNVPDLEDRKAICDDLAVQFPGLIKSIPKVEA